METGFEFDFDKTTENGRVEAINVKSKLEELPIRLTEEGHLHADILLVNFVKFLGYNSVADAYKRVGKWYV